MSLWWFACRCPVRKTWLPELLSTVWLAATAIVESMLLPFVAYLASSGLSYQTVRLYLSAVRYLQILCIGRDPLLELRGLL